MRSRPYLCGVGGAIRSLSEAEVWQQRVWRYIGGKDSHKSTVDTTTAHLLPLTIIPNFKLVLERPNAQIRRYFIYLTPYVLSSQIQIVVRADSYDYRRNPLVQLENSGCIAVKGNFAKRMNLSNTLKWTEDEVLRHILSDASLDHTDGLGGVWYTVFGIDDIRLDADSVRHLFHDTKVVGQSAQTLLSEYEQSVNWKIIDRRRSVISLFSNQVYSQRYDEMRYTDMLCHFNNYCTLMFLLHSISYSFDSCLRVIHGGGGTVRQDDHDRLLRAFDVYNKLRESTGWNGVIKKFEESHGGDDRIRTMYDCIKEHVPPPTQTAARTILFLMARPRGTVPLRVSTEANEIKWALALSKESKKFEFKPEDAVTPELLQRHLGDYKPEIVHFAMHGQGRGTNDQSRHLVSLEAAGSGGLVLEDDQGNVQLIPGETLAGFFKNRGYVKCVVLNLCYSDELAASILNHVDYVVGMREQIGDEAARKFSLGFYTSLFEGSDYKTAFERGRTLIEAYIPSEHLKPVFLNRRSETGFPPGASC